MPGDRGACCHTAGMSGSPTGSPEAAGAFAALDLRVGRVVEVEAFPEARRPAWKLAVDFGPELGTLGTSAQLTRYPRDALLGRLVIAAVNLGVKRIAGFRSEVLVLGAVGSDGAVRLLAPEEGASPGDRVA